MIEPYQAPLYINSTIEEDQKSQCMSEVGIKESPNEKQNGGTEGSASRDAQSKTNGNDSFQECMTNVP